jgi:hypothetical protein
LAIRLGARYEFFAHLCDTMMKTCVNQLIIGNASVSTCRSRTVSRTGQKESSQSQSKRPKTVTETSLMLHFCQHERTYAGSTCNVALRHGYTYIKLLHIFSLLTQSKEEEERKKKPEGKKQFCYSIRFTQSS